MKKLTPKEELFVPAYIVNLNAVEAARKAKYKHPKNVASKILSRPHVQAAIQEAMSEQMDRLQIDADAVVRELAKIGFANLKHYVRVTSAGEPFVFLAELTDDQFAAMSEVTVEDFTEGRGEDAREVRRVRFKLHDKRAALEALGRHFGIFGEDNRQKIPGEAEIKKSLGEMTPAEAAAEWQQITANVD